MKRKRIILYTRKGFTLIELMIVVVIMAILVAVAIPVYASVTQNAEAKTCANNRRVVSGLLTNYINGAFTGKTEEIPDFQIHNENKLPVFYDKSGGAPDASVSAAGAWLLGNEQDPSGLCCVGRGDGVGVFSVKVVHTAEGGVYVLVTCDKHVK